MAQASDQALAPRWIDEVVVWHDGCLVFLNDLVRRNIVVSNEDFLLIAMNGDCIACKGCFYVLTEEYGKVFGIETSDNGYSVIYFIEAKNEEKMRLITQKLYDDLNEDKPKESKMDIKWKSRAANLMFEINNKFGLTSREISKAIGVHQSEISRMISGVRDPLNSPS